MIAILSPLDSRRLPIEAVATPLPRLEHTPLVTRIYLLIILRFYHQTALILNERTRACRSFSRSKFGFVGASVRRCAWRTFRAVGGGCRSFSRAEFGFVGVAAGYLIFLRYKICFAVGRKRLRFRVLGRWNPKKFTILF